MVNPSLCVGSFRVKPTGLRVQGSGFRLPGKGLLVWNCCRWMRVVESYLIGKALQGRGMGAGGAVSDMRRGRFEAGSAALPRLEWGAVIALCAAKLLLHLFTSVQRMGIFATSFTTWIWRGIWRGAMWIALRWWRSMPGLR